jgi:group I intron endonuclease
MGRVKKAHIYKITSPTGRIYVGSSVNYTRRIKYYEGLHCKTQIKLYNSFLKHGFENHVFEIIEECHPSQKLIRECFYGQMFDVLGENGLNCLLPKSEFYKSVSDEKRKAQSERQKNLPDEKKAHLRTTFLGRKHTPEAIEKCRAAKMGNPSTLGQKQSEETKAKRSATLKGREIKPEWIAKAQATKDLRGPTEKEVLARLNNVSCKLVINLETGIYYTSAKEAERYSVYKKDQLRQMLNGQRKNKSTYIFA